MTLRRKLLIAFGGLAVLALLAAAVTVYITVRWQVTTTEAQAHYQRSLLLQSVRAQTFQALAEVNDALAGERADYADARADFERAIAGTEENFARWRDLSEDVRESVEILEVQSSYENLTTYARQVFARLEAGQLAEAVRLVDDELDTGDYARFQEATERAVAADERSRRSIVALSEELRRTALVMSAVTMIAALSLTLLIAAYLAQDLFQPLLELQRGLDGLAAGEASRRLAVDRADEFGRVAVAFNRVAEVQERRMHAAAPTGEGGEAADGSGARPVRILQEATSRLRAELAGLRSVAPEDRDRSLERLGIEADALIGALALGFPLDLQLVPVDPRQSAQEVLAAIAPLLAERGVSCECEFEPEERTIMTDRARLREVLNGTLRDALAALPERGGRIGLRVAGHPEAGRLHIDVATSGRLKGEETSSMAAETRTVDSVQVRMRRRILADQGAMLEIFHGEGGALVARLAFPLHG